MNCKPGDLAVVVRCDDAPHEVGLIVEVVAIAGHAGWIGDDFVYEGPGYIARKANGEKFVSEFLEGKAPVQTMYAAYQFDALRPIRNPPEKVTA